jgi:hypothetical protein
VIHADIIREKRRTDCSGEENGGCRNLNVKLYQREKNEGRK